MAKRRFSAVSNHGAKALAASSFETRARCALLGMRSAISNHGTVMAGLVPAVSLRDAQCPPDRGHREKPGDDNECEVSVPGRGAAFFTPLR